MNVEELVKLLKESKYDEKEIEFLREGFSEGFDLGYRGPENIQQTARNLKFTIGNNVELWNKVMKEVKEKRYAGPFKEIPYKNYIQSPIGLVPKDGGTKTRLIFHLSHPRDLTKGYSVNNNTPKEMTTVKYCEFDDAVRLCIMEGEGCHIGKSDMKKKKITLERLQQITGFLNFLGKAVVPGRTFTRRLYHIEERYVKKNLKQHHHVNLTAEMRKDLEMWLTFLYHPSAYARPFIDFDTLITSEDVDFYTDATANPELGCGGISGPDWYILQWNVKFIKKFKPSINYLELYAATVAITLWIHKFQNKRICIFCDNMSVVQMINKSTSSCKNCMVLLRRIVLMAISHNVKITVKHVPGKLNNFSDSLSMLQYSNFRKEARKQGRKFNNKPCPIPLELWPMENLWLKN